MNLGQNPASGHGMPQRSAFAAGFVLMLVGIAWIAVQFLDINLGSVFWPWFVIIPGLLLLGWGVLARERGGLGLSIAGCIVALTGLLLFYQSITGHWSSWSYAWALVAPGGVGLGMVLHGIVMNDSEQLRSGARMLLIAGALFAVGLIFFEVLIGVSGYGLDFWAWPLLLVVVGAGLLGYGYLRRK